LKKGELLVAGSFALVSIIVLIASVGQGIAWIPQQGPSAGMVPFYLALVMGLASVGIFMKHLKSHDTTPFFKSKRGLVDVWRIFFTAILLTVGIVWMGIYYPTFIFSVLFAKWLGEHKWWSSIVFALVLTFAVYFGMEKGLQLPLPKSFLYNQHGIFWF
jgi:hypothetical protein